MRLPRYYFYSFLAITFLIMAFAGCLKDEELFIKFITPDDNLVIKHDTILPISLDVNFRDRNVSKVELYINDSLVETFTSSPYEYKWRDATIDNAGKFIFKAIAYDNDSTTAEAEVNVVIIDYKAEFYGKYRFKLFKKTVSPPNPTVVDTIYYNGIVRKYKPYDSEIDLFIEPEDIKNPNNMITIVFGQNLLITSEVTEQGQLVEKHGFHYWLKKGNINADIVQFYLTNLGGLSYIISYNTTGTRIK